MMSVKILLNILQTNVVICKDMSRKYKFLRNFVGECEFWEKKIY